MPCAYRLAKLVANNFDLVAKCFVNIAIQRIFSFDIAHEGLCGWWPHVQR